MSEYNSHKSITINPRIIKHLGRDLITTSDVAVVELVKNSIDAKAKNINMYIYDNISCLEEDLDNNGSFQSEILDFIPSRCKKLPFMLIEDDGRGMNNNQLEKGFLEIGTGLKLDAAEGITLGEKGIGRLAAQRLGQYLLVETASENELYASLTFIDWEDIIKLNSDKSDNNNFLVPYKRIEKRKDNYTRLWIFDINVQDYLDTPTQLTMHFDNSELIVNRDLRSAINFLLSPFAEDKSNTIIKMFYNNIQLDIDFPEYMLNLSESTHYFRIDKAKNNITLVYSLALEPWFIERVHRVLVKSEAFKKLKKSHSYYNELLQNNQKRIDNALCHSLDEEQLLNEIAKTYEDLYTSGIKDKSARIEFSRNKAIHCLEDLKKILPISGEIYTFKQNAAVGRDIIIESVKEIKRNNKEDYTLANLKQFLNDYNGVKLYRDTYRIGFLGDKENDWIKLQQFRTKGQQWYRFDLGNTIGHVSVNDPEQKNIQEISSRLDISQNDVSDAFKMLINIVFNKLFYELNRKSNAIIKVILEEKGLLGESINKQVKKSTSNIDKAIQRNKQMLKTMQHITSKMMQSARINKDTAEIPVEVFNMVESAFKDASMHFQEEEKVQNQAVSLLVEADEQLKAIEVESYNNYKLMANGLITETITHELHSISHTDIEADMEEHFEELEGYFFKNKAVSIYNNHVDPVRSTYDIISNKLDKVGNLYSFLENTFIKKGTYDEFVNQCIYDTVNDIEQNLIKLIKKNNIIIECLTANLTWFVPKGVLIHVFYNLINNSIYWIDKRRKFAEADDQYCFSGQDKIIIESNSSDEIIVHDTGTGVIQPMEDILFEPLESGKPSGEGRGMGLYIVKKLLNSFNANIELGEERNDIGNKYKFIITLEMEESDQNVINDYL